MTRAKPLPMGPLFDSALGYGPALARKTDPLSSHRAADEATESGLTRSHSERCMRAVAGSPGCTSDYVAEAAGLSRRFRSLHRRASEPVQNTTELLRRYVARNNEPLPPSGLSRSGQSVRFVD